MIGSLVSGLLSAGGNIAGSLISAHQAELNREWQSEENQKNRDYQSNEWTRQFNMTNEYNDPKKQVQRMVSAGLNPAALDGASGVSGATPSAPGGASTSPTNPMPETFANLGSSLGNTFASLVQAFSNKNLNEEQKSMFSELAQKYANEAEGQLIQNKLANFEYDMQLLFGKDFKDAKLQKLIAEKGRIIADATLKGREASLADAQQLETISREILNYANAHLSRQNAALVGKHVKWSDAEIKSDIEKNIASAAESRASASKLREDARVSRVLADVREATVSEETYATLKKLKAEGVISEKQAIDAGNELMRLEKIRTSYNNHDSKLAVDAAVENIRKILGISVGANVSN